MFGGNQRGTPSRSYTLAREISSNDENNYIIGKKYAEPPLGAICLLNL